MKIKNYILLTMIFLGVASMAHAEQVSVYARQVDMISLSDEPNARPLIVIKAANVTQEFPADRARCFQHNNGEYEFRLERDHPYFKEIMAQATASYLTHQSVNITTRNDNDAGCPIQVFQLRQPI